MTQLQNVATADTYLSSGFLREGPLEPPDTTALREVVHRLVFRGTGAEAAETAPKSSIVAEMWGDALQQNREAVWQILPTRAMEAIEAEGEASLADLTSIAELHGKSRLEAVAAVRLLASIGEEALAPADKVRSLVLDFLGHRDPAVRLAAVESVWQLADRALATALTDALSTETHPEVTKTLRHVLALLG